MSLVTEIFPKGGLLIQPMVLDKVTVEGISWWLMVDTDDDREMAEIFDSFGWAGKAFCYIHPEAVYVLKPKPDKRAVE